MDGYSVRRIPLLLAVILTTHCTQSYAQDVPDSSPAPVAAAVHPASVTLPLINKTLSGGMDLSAASVALGDVGLQVESAAEDMEIYSAQIGDTSRHMPNYSLLLTFQEGKLTDLSITAGDETDLSGWLRDNIAALPQEGLTYESDSAKVAADTSGSDEGTKAWSDTWRSPHIIYSVMHDDWILFSVNTYSVYFRSE